MKTSSIKSITLVVLSILAFSCEKEQLQPNISNDTSKVEFRNEECDCDVLLSSIESDGQVLYFNAWEDVFATADCLDKLVEDHTVAFEESLGDVSEEEYNQIADDTGFDDYAPLSEKEGEWGITSVRHEINTAVDEWLVAQGEALDLATYPDNFPLHGESVRTLINANRQIVVGGQVSTFDDLPLTGEDDEDDDECKTNNRDKQTYTISNGQRQMLVKASVFDWVAFVRAGSTTKSYIRKNNKWKKRRAKIAARISGQFRTITCEEFADETSFSKTDQSRGKRSQISVSKIVSWNGSHLTYSQKGSCDVSGRGTINGTSRTLCL